MKVLPFARTWTFSNSFWVIVKKALLFYMCPHGISSLMDGFMPGWPYFEVWKVAFPWSEMQDRADLHSVTGGGKFYLRQIVNPDAVPSSWEIYQ